MTSDLPGSGLLGTQNLNDVLRYGIYGQEQNAQATSARNYPFTEAGYLTVTQGPYNYIQEYVTLGGKRAIRPASKTDGSTWAGWTIIDAYTRTDKATAANITAGTSDKVVTSDVLMPFLKKAYSDVTASRSLGVTYTNNTGYEITVHVDGRVDGGNTTAYAYVNGVIVNRLLSISQAGTSLVGTYSFAVPAGATYKVDGMATPHASVPYKWVEYR